MRGLSRNVKTVNELASSPRYHWIAGNTTVVLGSLNKPQILEPDLKGIISNNSIYGMNSFIPKVPTKHGPVQQCRVNTLTWAG